ncbi:MULTISPECIES: MFS transporter [Ureibacillus]|jgi:MFS transporter, DHA1 family, multidrug resistance protein|nr:MFS transporter [Ureibacillus thermosphaericus]NKZ33164.1 MFS transporter [Ureibacillus thermosphaericus]
MSQRKKKLVMFMLMFNLFITMGGIGMVVPVLPSYLDLFGVGGTILGFLVADFAFAQFIFSPIAGNLSDLYGRKFFVILGLIVFGFSQIFFGIAKAIWMLFFARFLSGAGAAFIMPPVMAYVADITTVEERGKGMGFLGAAISLGFMIGPGIGGFLAKVNLHFPFYFGGIVALIAAIVSFIVLPNIKQQQKERLITKGKDNIFQQLLRSLHTPYFVMLLVVFVFSFGIANFQSTLSMYLTYKFGYTPMDIAIVMIIGGFLGVILQVYIVDQLFKRFGEMKVILVNLIIAALSMVGMVYIKGFFIIITITSIFQIATTFIRPAVNTLISKLAGAEQGFAAGMNNAYMSLGNMVGPALAGIMLEWKLSSPFILGAFILFACYILAHLWTMKKAPQLLKANEEY